MKNQISRRGFMSIIPITTLGLMLSRDSIFASNLSVLRFNKPNSKFGGVQIGAITYSFRSMPHDIDQLLKFCVDSNVSAIEMMGDPAEEFAGKPKNPNPFRMPQKSTPPAPRPPMTDEMKAKIAEYAKRVAEWRSTVSMDKFKEKLYFGIIHYAKRQKTWFKNNKELKDKIRWFNPTDMDEIKDFIQTSI